MGAATPTGSDSGYTIFVTGDAIFANSETEGTIAVGGTATFGDSRGNQNQQYPIMHGGVGGNADYETPTIDGEHNRVLLQRFASEKKVVQVKSQGASGADATAGAKIADTTTPLGYTFHQMFGGDGTTFFPAGGDNQSPQIDSAVQTWKDLETAKSSWGTSGAVLDYFPQDIGSEALASFDKWQEIDAPAGNDQTITLSSDGPSTLSLASFAGISKFKLAGYSEHSFLVITVDPSDVVDGRVTLPSYSFAGKSDDGDAISYILFDFSKITGDVEVVSPNEPVRGSIYAPNAHVTFPAESNGGREFEGQLIAKSLTALQSGKEMHTNLFKGTFPCSSVPVVASGSFSVSKVLSGVDASDFPEGTTFPVTASWDGGSKVFDLPADGSVVEANVDLPEGTVVSFVEGVLPDAPAGYSFVSNSLSADSITILAGGDPDIAWSVTNTYVKTPVVASGSFSVSKVLSGVDASDFPEGTTFPVTASWDGGSKVFDLPADGSVVEANVDLPEGTVVSFVEGVLPDAPAGYSFVSNSLSADSITILAGGDPDIAWSVTNTYVKTPVEPTQKLGGFDLRKVLSGINASDFVEGTVFTVVAQWTQDGQTISREYLLPADGSTVTGPRDIPVDTTVTFSEVKIPTAEGFSFVTSSFSSSSIVITDEAAAVVSVTNTYAAPELPNTGASVVGFGLGAVVLVGAGVLLLITRRKRTM